MPTQTDKLTDLRENSPDDQLPYISKSRLTTYKTCARKFYYSYIKGLKTPSNFYMKRGTRIHEAFEIYYENMADDWYENGAIQDDLSIYLPDDTMKWGDFVEPFISNFLLFEYRRREACGEQIDSFLPVGIEAEGWDEQTTPPWMGYADAILQACSMPEIESDTGVVIVDFKTGKTPKEKYRDDGIFLEGEYYSMLFEDEWDIAAVAGYFPKNDDVVVSPLSEERRSRINRYIEEMTDSREREDFPVNEQPLCKWSEDDDDQCDFYGICSSSWGERGGPGPTYD